MVDVDLEQQLGIINKMTSGKNSLRKAHKIKQKKNETRPNYLISYFLWDLFWHTDDYWYAKIHQNSYSLSSEKYKRQTRRRNILFKAIRRKYKNSYHMTNKSKIKIKKEKKKQSQLNQLKRVLIEKNVRIK